MLANQTLSPCAPTSFTPHADLRHKSGQTLVVWEPLPMIRICRVILSESRWINSTRNSLIHNLVPFQVKILPARPIHTAFYMCFWGTKKKTFNPEKISNSNDKTSSPEWKVTVANGYQTWTLLFFFLVLRSPTASPLPRAKGRNESRWKDVKMSDQLIG